MPIDPPLPLVDELDVPKDRAYNDMARYLNSLQDGSSVSTTKTYTTTINYNTANLGTTGATLFSPTVGSTIEDVRIEIVTPFSGNSVVYDAPVMKTDGTDDPVLLSGVGLDSLSASASDKLVVMGPTSASRVYLGESLANQILPAIIGTACTLKLLATVAADGPATAGQMKVHVLVSEPDA